MEQKQPTYGNGKICYIEIPTNNIAASSSFYRHVFGWEIRTRGDGTVAFNDAVTEVSGTWVLNREAHTGSGLLIYIMIDSLSATQAAITLYGGQVIATRGHMGKEMTSRFSDPYGNVFGLYQL